MPLNLLYVIAVYGIWKTLLLNFAVYLYITKIYLFCYIILKTLQNCIKFKREIYEKKHLLLLILIISTDSCLFRDNLLAINRLT